MRILILHQHFKSPESGGAIRSYYLAKALVAKGHRVVIITASHVGVASVEQMEGIEVHYLPVVYDNRFSFNARARAFISFVFLSVKRAYRFRDFDICYAISVPLTVGLIARWLKFRHGLKFIFEVGDLWPDAPIQMGFIKNHFFQSILYALERSTYRSAESIVALSPAIQLSIQNKEPGKTIYMIPNMADCDFFQPESKKPLLQGKFNVNGKFVVSYIGALGFANGLEFFLDCAQGSQKADIPVHFILCGDGAMRKSLHAKVTDLALKNFTFVDFVNRDGVKEILNVTDAVFVCYRQVPILETGSPNKFFDGLAAGKLIIINFKGWIWEELDEGKCGIFVDPKQPRDFVQKIIPFVSDSNMLSNAQRSSRALAEEKYSRQQLSESFAKLFS